MYQPLSSLPPGRSCRVAKLSLPRATRRRLREIGLIENTEISCLFCDPPGEIAAYLIRGAVIALRREDAQHISINRE